MQSEALRVLMVDDNQDDFIIVRRLLSSVRTQKFAVEWAFNSRQALELAQKAGFAIFLVDYRLGPESGLDFLKESRRVSRAPVILLTGLADFEVDLEAMKLGADDFLNKNKLDADILERTIRYALERREAQEALRKRNEYLNSILDSMGEGVALADAGGRLAFFNRAAKKILGSEPDPQAPPSWVRHYGFYLADGETPFPAEEFPLTRAIRGEEADNVQAFVRNDNVPQGAFVSVTARPLKDEDGRPKGGLAVFRDVTDLKKAEEQLARNALYNPLTNLPNRALFLDRVGQALQRLRKDSSDGSSVMFLGLGGIRKINDTLGSGAGDLLLKQAARRLENILGPRDTAAHLGGSEFAALLDGVPEGEALRFAQKVLKAFGEPFDLEGQPVFPDAALGVVSLLSPYAKAEEVLRDAHVAMYWARRRSKNGYEVFNHSMAEGLAQDLRLETDLRRALERREFLVYYQPIVEVETGALSGFEALLRWNHPKRGMVSPADFIPLAEETGLILPIGDWVLEEACRQRREWLDRFKGDTSFSVSVNLSARQFIQRELVSNILRRLQENRLEPEHLHLEITESVVMENFETASLVLHQLKNNRIHLHMDDFGTGYSSLSQLHRFPLDVLKIDQSFVKPMTGGESKVGIVRAIIALASELGMGVIAEGVETREHLEKLKSLKCRQAQGYFFAKPMAAQAVGELLTSGPRWSAN